MLLAKRDHQRCYDDITDTWYDCHAGFWYSEKGVIVKWAITGAIFFFFFAWFVGGHIHAKRRLRKGLPLLGYHRFLVSYSTRRKYGQAPQNHFSFYQTHNPYGQAHHTGQQPHQQQPYGQRADGTYAEPPPIYNGTDAPPSYYGAPGAAKPYPDQNAPQYSAPQYGVASQPGNSIPLAPQQTGVTGAGSNQMDVESQNQHNQGPQLPPRPQQAKMALSNIVSRFRR